MRVALIENGTKEPKMLVSLLAGYDITHIPFERASDALSSEHDLIILSGSSRFPVIYNLDHLSPEIKLIRESTVPLLGICFGCELINVAFGGTLKDLGTKVSGVRTVQSSVTSGSFSATPSFDVYEGHRWSIDTVAPDFESLAISDTGPEIIRHTSRPIYGFQFHPEKLVEETHGDELFTLFLRDVGLLSSTEVDS